MSPPETMDGGMAQEDAVTPHKNENPLFTQRAS